MFGVHDAIDICAGNAFTCVLTWNYTVQCTGVNSLKQLGDTTTNDRSYPVLVQGLINPVSSILCGYAHVCVIYNNNGMACWGVNVDGQLGRGATSGNEDIASVTSYSSGGVLFGSAGRDHTCIITDPANAVMCTGKNGFGQLGDGTTTGRTVFTQATGLTSGVTSLACGYSHTCAISGGGVYCWGDNYFGQLGLGTNTETTTPLVVTGIATFSRVMAAREFTCVHDVGTDAKCWGVNTVGQFGRSNPTESNVAIEFGGGFVGISEMQGGYEFICILTTPGTVKCAGTDTVGQLGNGNPFTNSPLLVDVVYPTLSPTQMPHTTANPYSGGGNTDQNLVAIIAGSVSGGVVLLLLLCLTCYCCGKTSRKPTAPSQIVVRLNNDQMNRYDVSPYIMPARNNANTTKRNESFPTLLRNGLKLPSDKRACFFLSHTWSNGNHEKVAQFAKVLQNKGMSVWFDGERLIGDIEGKITQGLHDSVIFVACITDEYLAKVDSTRDGVDWCAYEWSAAFNSHGKRKTIAVATQESCANPSNWANGRVKNLLSSTIVIDASHPSKFDEAAESMFKVLLDDLKTSSV